MTGKSDQQLKQDVTTELRFEPSVNEAHIGVSVNHGIVTLSGHVPSFGEKYGAERAAKRVFGVKAVANELDVKLGMTAQRNDQDIAESCLAALRANAVVPDEQIKVLVANGWVTLEGRLEWQYEREAAERAVKYLIGVRGITNQITLEPRVSPEDVKAKIEAALKRSAEVDSRGITVEARDGTVILHGRVHSWAERNEAQHAAWSAPGVRQVQNDIVVTG